MTITKQMITGIRTDMEKALEEIGSKHNVSLKSGRCSYRDSTATFKVEMSTKDASGTVVTKELEALSRAGYMYDLKAENAGVIFYQNGERYEFTGINTRARSYPLCGKRLRDGQKMKFPTSVADVIRQAHRIAA